MEEEEVVVVRVVGREGGVVSGKDEVHWVQNSNKEGTA